MGSYIVRRLLLMIPTLFGVTVVSFVIMQLAPGDPQLSQLAAGGVAGQSSQTRESYLLQKRDLNLDKPIALNFDWFRDYGARVRLAAHLRSLSRQQLLDELTKLAGPPGSDEATDELAFLESLKIPDFKQRLRDAKQRAALATAVQSYVTAWCENTGSPGVPAAIALLDTDGDRKLKLGALRVLTSMAPDPFTYSFSRDPRAGEAAEVEQTWRIWWERSKGKFPPLDAERKKVLAIRLQSMAQEPSRQKRFEQLELLDRDDTPFFIDALASDAPLAPKAIAAAFLVLYNNRPLEVEVPLDAGDEQVAQVAENWRAFYRLHQARYAPGLGRKLWNVVADTQYAHMIVRLATFNFGRSALKTREPVGEKIWNAATVSAPLMLVSEVGIYLVAVPLGILCAVYRGRRLDRAISLGLFLLYSIPSFVAGMLFLLFLCYGSYLKWFPMERLHASGAENYGWLAYILDYVWHAFLPVICLSLFSLAGLAMYARSAMLDVINQDYVRTARAKGLSSSKVILKHVLRNGMIPIVTLFSSFLPALLGGSVLVEVLFNIPGMGLLSFSSIEQKDIPTLMALIYVEAIIVLASILLTDLLYVVIDPRISFESKRSAA